MVKQLPVTSFAVAGTKEVDVCLWVRGLRKAALSDKGDDTSLLGVNLIQLQCGHPTTPHREQCIGHSVHSASASIPVICSRRAFRLPATPFTTALCWQRYKWLI